MDMEMIRMTVEKSMDKPQIFLAYVTLVFAVVVLIGGIIVYLTACVIQKKTQMTGLVRMRVTLNRWPDDTKESQSPMLYFGSYLIGMQDPEKIVKNRLDPKLTGLDAAQCRRYSVSLLLERFRSAFDNAGFAGDPASELLDRMLYDESFCEHLGQISRKSAGRGLTVHADAATKREGSSRDNVSIFYTIPGNLVESFERELHCDAKMLCVTLEYSAR